MEKDTPMEIIFTPTTIGQLTIPNRLVMAPMTRSRAGEDGVPSPLAATYYGQRAAAGLIITEGVFPTAMGKGYVRTPGIETEEQVAAWKKVTASVHARGGRIFMQLMHCGRISHPFLLPGGALPVAPSAIRPDGKAWTPVGQVDFVTPRELTTPEIAGIVDRYRQAARRAIEAGFDGVELHNASGYLPEQFLSTSSNQRTDRYGGSIQNRARFSLEVLEAMTQEIGADRVGIKISPEMHYNSIVDDTPQQTYTYLVEQLNRFGLAYLHVATFGAQTDYNALLRPLFKGAYLVGGGLAQKAAEDLLSAGKADATVFGSAFLANPDLPVRFLEGLPLNQPDRQTFFAGDEKGYADYPFARASATA